MTDDAEFKKKYVSKEEKQKEHEKKAKQEEQRGVVEKSHSHRCHTVYTIATSQSVAIMPTR